MNRFLEVCLLIALKEGPMHGYGLIERIEPFGFYSGELNLGPLYRTLRKMEEQMLVSSAWQEGEGGPRKRVYEITPAGEEALVEWIEILTFRQQRLDKVISYYREKLC